MASSRPAPPTGESASTGSVPPRVGEHIQRLRNERKLTLDDLSRAAGVSKSMLSEIERDKANPTIAVAWRLTNALGISLDQLFAQQRPAEAIRVSSLHEIPTLMGDNGDYQLRVWGPIELAGKFEWYELTLQAGAELRSNAHEPGTREHLTVLNGALEVEALASTRRLKAGETARYAADDAHAIRNVGRSEAKALLVVIHG
ncbi:XRE family transcriptional regulator [Caballeronia sp. LZ062]|uniref:helix-turn-helix domain-containing protein n=1 Tax=unclassified Caballeronia TaxID=2646786 RepID=UPI00285BC20C|nr:MULTISPECIES: XRE family transcriptional regulator [unclassified Caballeronia]MDR5857094.1 XRE family transcriptional regulator [Caballeronia sp. LZ050]MDR5869510.1 XRE family transcriptional regulator [Caballeronia sp. LZ062]